MNTDTDLDIARKISTGELSSPQTYENVTLYALRITGTGVAFRSKSGEYVYRPPEEYLTQDFLDRCAGIPVIWEHPDSEILDSIEFAKRVIGSIMFAYLVDNEVWGIGRVYDEAAVAAMQHQQMSTSPCVVFATDGTIENEHLDAPMLVEGRPLLLDHVAICEEGVWDKGGEPTGVNTNQTVRTAMDESVTSGPSLSDVVKLIQSLGERLDRLEQAEVAEITDDGTDPATLMGDPEMGEHPVKAPDSDLDMGGQNKEAVAPDDCNSPFGSSASDEAAEEGEEIPEEAAADAMPDIEDEKEGEKTVATDSAVETKLRERIEKLEAMLSGTNDAERNELSEIQHRADSVATALSEVAPAPLPGEKPVPYRRRLLDKFKKYSDDYKNMDLSGITSPDMLNIIERTVYADAMAASKSTSHIGTGRLVSSVERDATGRSIVTYHGDNKAWMQDFMYPTSKVAGFSKGVR